MNKKILVIVESPAKCKKIQGFLGPNYIVKASFGHIRNIDKSKGLSAINIKNNYNPTYSIINEKKKYITDLKKHVKKVSEVIIASDLDREGEAIGYHIINVLKLDINNTKRIVFNEITKSAIQKAVQNPRFIDMNLFYAQQARQILDFLIGYDISPVLWKYVKNKISAGRCQSPALKLICEKEMDILKFNSQTYFDLSGVFMKDKMTFHCKSSTIFNTKNDLYKTYNEFKKTVFFILNMIKSKSKNKPSDPYITSTIQQDASTKLGMSPKNTMSNLQKLYEKGKITYMRTDSKVISQQCLQSIHTYINSHYGNEYYQYRKYSNTKKNVQEAHECIRPVDMTIKNLDDTYNQYEKKIYTMIWKRTIASQMKDLLKDVLKVVIGNKENKIHFEAIFEKTIFLGFSIIYDEKTINEIDPILNIIKTKDIVKHKSICSNESVTTPKARYTEASLIKDLEKKGIGRPSTFSSIVETLFNREYIEKKTDKGVDTKICIIQLKTTITENCKIVKINSYKNKIIPTELGMHVNKFMLKHFSNLLDIQFTSNMEMDLDKIANGDFNWVDLVDNTYKMFHPIVQKLCKEKTNKKDIWKQNNKPLGINPNTNKPIYCYKAKYGPIIKEGDDKPLFVGIPKDINLDEIDLDKALDFLSYPKWVGNHKNKDIMIHISHYGYYIKYDNKKFSIVKDTFSNHINLKDAISIINKKNKNVTKEFKNSNISIRDGQYGPYILKSGKNGKIVSIPKNINPIDLSLKECEKYLKKK